MRSGAQSEYRININFVQAGRHELRKALAVRFSRHLIKKSYPELRVENHSATQKGLKENFKNYKPTSLFSQIIFHEAYNNAQQQIQTPGRAK